MRRTLTCIVPAVLLGGGIAIATASGARAQSAGGSDVLPDPSELGTEEDPDSKRDDAPVASDSETTSSSGSEVRSESTPSVDASGEAEGSPEDGDDGAPESSEHADTSESGGASPASGAEPKSGAEDSGSESAEASDPPVQVRRAVDSVSSSAHSVAGSIAEGEEATSPDEDESKGRASDGPSPQVRRLEREQKEQSDDATDEGASGGSSEGPKADEFLGTIRSLFREESRSELSLESYVQDDRWNHAMQLLVDDECRKALDRVDTIIEESPRDLKKIPAVRYAVARIKVCAGRTGEGRKTLRELRQRDDVVAELAQRSLGAAPAPIDANGEGPSHWTERMERARELGDEGELSEALDRLARLRDDVDRAWHRYKVEMTATNLLLRAGKLKRASRKLLGLYRLASGWKVGDRIQSKIERLEKRHGMEILTLGARVDRMRELISRGKYEKAKDVSIRNAEIAGVSGVEVRGWSSYRRGLQAERRQRREKAVELFEEADRLVNSPVIRSRLYFGWARALRRLDRDDEAIDLYRRLFEEYPRHHLCDDARFEIGRLHQYANRHEAARAAFAELAGMHPDSEHIPQALWRGAFSAYLSGDYDSMDRPLARLVREFPDVTDASGLPIALKARYWRGVAAFKRGDLDEAERRFQATINAGGLTWYGRLAARRMERFGAQPIVPRPPVELAPSDVHDLTELDLPDHPRYRVAAEYARLGLYENAIGEMERQLDVRPVPDKAFRFLANLKLVDGNAAEAHWTMGDRIEAPAPTFGTLRDWGLAYPVEFRDPTRRYATKFDVPPHLVQALIRQESGFRTEVSSGVGAVGLMQLMPGSADAISRDFFDGSDISRSDLQTPEENVRLGTAYVRAMLTWVEGRVPMALAGYNAGPAPLEDWFQRFGEREMDAWVESITYRQARGYVRKVYTSYIRYRALYAGKLPSVRLSLPRELGDWTDVPELQKEGGEGEVVSVRE